MWMTRYRGEGKKGEDKALKRNRVTPVSGLDREFFLRQFFEAHFR